MMLHHYFERSAGPFLSVTRLPRDEAAAVLARIRERNPNLVNPDIDGFLARRYALEARLRAAFVYAGGEPASQAPVYLTLGEHPQLASWFDEPCHLQIDARTLDPRAVSYTYGDLFAAFNPKLDDGREFWGRAYTLDGILSLIGRIGMPPDVAYDVKACLYPKDKPIGEHLKYVEAQVWSDEALARLREAWMRG